MSKAAKKTLSHRILHTFLSEHPIHSLFSLQYSLILHRPPNLFPAIRDTLKQSKTRKRYLPPEQRMSQKPKILRILQNSQSCTSLISLFSPSSLTLHSLWTGLYSAAGRPLCTCWQPLGIVSAWPVHCPACGEVALSAASHPFPSSMTLGGRTWGLPPGSSGGRRRAQQKKHVKRRNLGKWKHKLMVNRYQNCLGRNKLSTFTHVLYLNTSLSSFYTAILNILVPNTHALI